jgi:protein-S-isoprenylcysteine O-methyltransferase Ste14
MLARAFTWLGAILFAISLGHFGFQYFIRFAETAPQGRIAMSVAWNVTLFTIFALHHSVFARIRVRSWIARSIPAELERSFYVWVASLLFIAVCAWWQPVPGVAWRVDGVWVWGLWALQALGVWLTLRSAAILDIRDLAGIPVGRALSGSPREPGRVRATSLTEYRSDGPYGWVRHPIYTGWFLMVLAATPMTMTRLVFAIVSCAYLVLAIPFEERSMRASGDAYDRYMAKVRWRLLPRVY